MVKDFNCGAASYSLINMRSSYCINPWVKRIISYRFLQARAYSNKQQGLNIKLDPAKVYSDLLNNKVKVISENKKKSGVYLWKHIKSNKIYIGSSIDIARRFYGYCSQRNLVINKTMIICKSLLKYGISQFSFSILEYCEPENVLSVKIII